MSFGGSRRRAGWSGTALGQCSVQATRQAGAGRHALDAAARAAAAQRPVRPDDDVTDVAGVAAEAVQQAAIEDDAAAHAGRDDHAEHVVGAAPGAAPALAECQCLGIVVDDARQVEGGGETLAQRKARARRGC